LRRLLSAVLSVALLFPVIALSAGPVAASVSCPAGADVRGSGTTYVVLYEATNYAGVYAPDGRALCLRAPTATSASWSSLKNVTYSDQDGNDGVCDGQLFTSFDTWNDCASSFKVGADCHHKVTLYQDASFGGAFLSYTTAYNKSTLGAWNDVISSVKITYTSACATSGGV